MPILVIWVILSLILLPVYINFVKEYQAEDQNSVIKAAEDIIRGE